MKFLIAGLGNIGAEYEMTRHNIGFMVLDKLAENHDVDFEQGRHVFFSEIKIKGKTAVLIKPSTYMNLSGKAVRYWLNEAKIDISNLLIVTDDIALPFGKNRIKAKGSHGGHNGLRNIEELIGTKEFPRLRMGVGDNFSKGKQVDYVLSPFSKDEFEELPIIIDKAIESIEAFCTIGIERTMNFYN